MWFLRFWGALLINSVLVSSLVNNIVQHKGYFRCTHFDLKGITLKDHETTEKLSGVYEITSTFQSAGIPTNVTTTYERIKTTGYKSAVTLKPGDDVMTTHGLSNDVTTGKTTDQISTATSISTFSQFDSSKLEIGTGVATTFSWLGEDVSSISPARASSTPYITPVTTTIAATTTPSYLHTTTLGSSTSVTHPVTRGAVTSDPITATRAPTKPTTSPDTTVLAYKTTSPVLTTSSTTFPMELPTTTQLTTSQEGSTTLKETAVSSSTPVSTSGTKVSTSVTLDTTSATTVFPLTTLVGTTSTTESSSKATDSTSTSKASSTATSAATTKFQSSSSVSSTIKKVTAITETDSNSESSDETFGTDTPSSSCPTNMILMGCTCQATCADPYKSSGCHGDCSDPGMTACICPDGFYLHGDHCVPAQECGCYLPSVGVIPNGEFHVNFDCSEICFCDDEVLSCDYECSRHAVCVGQPSMNYAQCTCSEGFYGNGLNCTRFHDCQDLFDAGYTTEGVYTLKPPGWSEPPFDVYCEEGWMIFQRRINGSIEFNRTWDSYKQGFGDPDGEFWLGNEKLSFFTSTFPHQLRIELERVWGTSSQLLTIPSVWIYEGFQISHESNNFALTFDVGSIDEQTGYDYLEYHKDKPFTTFDKDNDYHNSQNCALRHSGGWWHKQCFASNLNGMYGRQDETGICLVDRHEQVHVIFCNVTFTEMAMRPG